MDELKRVCKERDAALLSLDEQKIKEFARKHAIQIPENEMVFWAGVHKAIVALNTATTEQKMASFLWLAEHGCWPGVFGGA